MRNNTKEEQLLIEELSNKWATNKVLKEHILANKKLLDKIGEVTQEEMDAYITAISYMMLYKRQPISVVVGVMLSKYSKEFSIQILESCVEKGIFEYYKDNQVLFCKFMLDSKTATMVDRFQYPLPMVVKPKKVKHNFDCPYLLSKSKSIVLRSNMEEDVNLDVINLLNSIEYSVNKEVYNNLEMVTKEGTAKNQYQLNRLKENVKDVTGVFEGYHHFYLTWSYDKRGRIYDNGYLIHIQGVDYQKAIVNFAKYELLNEE